MSRVGLLIIIILAFTGYLYIYPCYSHNLDSVLLEKFKNNSILKERQKQNKIYLSRKLLKNKNLEHERMLYAQAENELMKQSKLIEHMLYNYSPFNYSLTTGFIRPVVGEITSGFGAREHPVFQIRGFHTGIDIAGQNLIPVHASNYGKIISTGWRGGYGNTIIISHGKYKGINTSTLYGHLTKILVTENQIVKKGQAIGLEGSTGTSTGPHLHFEVRENGIPVNPLQFFK